MIRKRMKTVYRKYDRLINSELGEKLSFLQKVSNVRKGITMMNAEKKFRKFKRQKLYYGHRMKKHGS